MKFVKQTVTGDKGNCMSACLASVLGLPIESVPNFHETSENAAHWWQLVRRWLAERNFGIITLNYSEEWMLAVGGIHIVAGKSDRGRLHAVIYEDGKMIHDPHPDNTGIISPETMDFIFPLDPAKITERVDDLLEANNRYQERYRAADSRCTEAYILIESFFNQEAGNNKLSNLRKAQKILRGEI